MKKLFLLLVVIGALLIGFQVGIDRDDNPAAAPVASEPNPFDQFDPPAAAPAMVVDTSGVDKANAEIRHAARARLDAQAVADEMAAAQQRRRPPEDE